MDDAAAVTEVLDERPELEASMEAVLAVDDEHDEWAFDEVPIGSGEFGELVSHGLVEQTADGDGYRVADPPAVRAALNDEFGDEPIEETGAVDLPGVSREAISARLDGVDRLQVGALLGALLAVVLARAYVYPSVFRDGVVVLSGNDPYYYRYWVEQALAASGGVLDFSSLATMPEAVRTGEPLLVATLWLFASLFGGDATAAGWIVAWYPVVAAVFTACVVYLLAMQVTDDRRVALAAVLLLAVTPAHAFRTSLGFGDHHAFDYVWLAVTTYALVRLDAVTTADWRSRRQWGWAVVLALAVSGQVLAWDAGPLLLAPLALYVAVRVLHDVRSERAPLSANLPLLGGVGVGAVLVFAVHILLGWHSGTVAFSPVLLIFGTLGVFGLGELAHRYEVSVSVLAGVEGIGLVVGLLALRVLRPEYWADLMDGLGRITESRNVAEMQSLLSGDTLGWLLLFGFVLVLAVPVLVWATVEAYRGERTWLVPSVYCWFFLVLAMYQVRFAGELAMFTSVFAALGFLYLAGAVNAVDSPALFADESRGSRPVSMPSWQSVGQLALLFLLVSGLSIVQVPIKTGQVTTDSDAYRTAAWMGEYADERGWEYPENYVLSPWSSNRMYNYFVNGESESYTFAEQYYGRFLGDTNPTRWYERLDGRAGFVLTRDGIDLNGETIYTHLHEHYGGEGTTVDNTGRFRAIYETPDGSYKVFTPVAGALVAGQTSPNGSGTVRADVELPKSSFVYERQVTGTENGWYMLRVPYATTYGLAGNETVTVTESDVDTGAIVNVRSSNATWPLNSTEGEFVFDHTGGNHGRLINAQWNNTEEWTGVSFNGDGYIEIADDDSLEGTEGFTLSVRFRTRENIDYEQDLQYPRIVANSPSGGYDNTDGYQIVLSKGHISGIVGNGSSTARVRGGEITDGRWYNATLTWDGSTVQFYLNDELVDTGTFSGSPENNAPLVFGASSDGSRHFVGSIANSSYSGH